MITDSESAETDFTKTISFLLKKSDYEGNIGAPGCWIGGLPTLPKRFDWPWRIENGEAIHPLHFIAQINLSQLPLDRVNIDLPTTGTLFFFANYVSSVEGQSAVIYAEDDVANQLERSVPDFPEDFEEHGVQAHWVGNRVVVFRKWPIEFHEYSELSPSKNAGSDQFSWIYDAQLQKLRRTLAAPSKKNRLWDWIRGVDYGLARYKLSFHRFLGVDAIPRVQASNQGDFIRLLTIEHDEDIGFLFSSEELGFFIDRAHLSERRFEKSYALQC